MARHLRLISTTMLVLSLLAFFGLMVYLASFSLPQTDDYNIMKDVKTTGFAGYDSFIYKNWGGRFVSIWLGKIQAYNNGLLNNYWIHTSYLLLANAASCFYLFRTVNRLLIRFTDSVAVLALTALVYLALQISTLPEISTAYYWFSSAVSYQPAIIMIQVELALVIHFVFGSQKGQRLYLAGSIILLVILINFTNEVSVLVNGMILLITGLLLRAHKGFLVAAWMMYVITAFITITAPGNRLRAESIPTPGIPETIAYAMGRALFACWTVLKNPVVILGVVTAFIAGQRCSLKIVPPKPGPYLSSPIFVCAVPIVILVMILIPIMYVSNGSFPDRANNEIVQVLVMLVLSLACISGAQHREPPPVSTRTYLPALVFAIGLICNNTFGILATSAISAPVYAKVMHQRVDRVKAAAAARQHSTSVLSYTAHADSLLDQLTAPTRTTHRAILRQPPGVYYFPADEAVALNKLGRFYGLNKVTVRQ